MPLILDMGKVNIKADMKNKGVICIGANLGQEVEGWISLGIRDFILFEPVSATFKKLERIISNKQGNYKLFNFALGNITGEVEMYVETCHQGKSSSILEPLLHLVQYPDIEFEGRETVKIDKLDNIEYDRIAYDKLHIDTQGFELEVLKGAENSLKFIEEMTIEVYRKELYRGCPMIEETTKFLIDHGFYIQDIFWRGLSWGDAIVKRR